MPIPSSIASAALAVLALLLAPGTTSPLADIGPAPDVALTDAAGKPFSLADLRGKAVLVSFVYTTCTGSCPATTLHLTRVQSALEKDALWAKRVHFVSITLDPARDRPEVLAAYAKNYGIDQEAWHFLTGRPDQVLPIIRAWGMWVKTGRNGVLDHPSRLFLIDPNGRQREIYNLETLTPKVVVGDVRTILGE